MRNPAAEVFAVFTGQDRDRGVCASCGTEADTVGLLDLLCVPCGAAQVRQAVADHQADLMAKWEALPCWSSTAAFEVAGQLDELRHLNDATDTFERWHTENGGR